MQKIIPISIVVLKESIRGKLFVAFLFIIFMFFIFSIYISTLSLGTVARFIENTGMLGNSIISFSVTVLFGLFYLYQEKERNELYVLLNRVSRSSYLLGRFLGTSYIIILFSLITGIGIFFLTWVFGNKITFGIFLSVYLNILEYTLLLAVGMFFYTLGVGFTLNSLMVVCIYILGHSLNEAIISFIGLGKFGNPVHLAIVKAIAIIFPNFDMFDFRLSIVHGEHIPVNQIMIVSAYWFFYLTGLLSLGSAIMKKKDI